MILFLNYLPWIIVLLGFICYMWILNKGRTKLAISVFVLSLIVAISVLKMTPTYMPKGTVQGLPEVHLQEPKGEIKDNLLSAKSNEQRDKEFKETFDAKEKVQELLKTTKN